MTKPGESQADSNANEPEQTVDSLDKRKSSQTSNEETMDSIRPFSSAESKNRSNATQVDATLAPKDLTGKNEHTGRSAMVRHTANPIEITIASQGSPQDDDDGFDLRTQTAGRDGLPAKIGRYEIRRLLGEGAFGQVFEARDPQLDRIVAVKVAKSFSGKTQVERFLREARAAAQLRHPNVIPVYEYGEVEGENIIVYEFVAGETLKALIRREQSLPIERVVDILRQIADGLDYAHSQGIIHRDIKPENILIDADGKPHIADFGCARTINDQTELTIEGSILGTPVYMSPEQASGKAKTADRRSDIWSVGVMLYEMVSGQRPFHGSLSDLLFWICNHDPKPLRKIHPPTPIDIETICTKCLQRELDSRYSTAGELSNELGRFQRGEPILSRRINPVQRIWMWAKRNRAIASLSAAVASTLIVATIVSSLFAIQAYRERKNRAIAQMSSLKNAEATSLPAIFESIAPFRSTILPRLKEQLPLTESQKEKQRTRLAILNLETELPKREKLADEMLEDLLTAAPDDFFVCRQSLEFHKASLNDKLWSALKDSATTDTSVQNDSATRFRASAALAMFDPESPNWDANTTDVVGSLTSMNQVEMAQWIPAFRPIREKLKPKIVSEFRAVPHSNPVASERIAAVAARLFQDQTSFLIQLLPAASDNQIPHLTEAFNINRAESIELIRKAISELPDEPANVTPLANMIAAWIHLDPEYPWNHFFASKDPTLANLLIEKLGPSSTPFEALMKNLTNWKSLDPDMLSGILLSIGEYRNNQILQAQRENLANTLLLIFTSHADARVHTCCRWLLCKLGQTESMLRKEEQLCRPTPEPGKNWHVDLNGNTFVIFDPVDRFEMGLDSNSLDPLDIAGIQARDEPRHLKTIPRRFGICIQEVTIEQFEQYESYLLNRFSAQVDEFSEAEPKSKQYRTRKRLQARIAEIARKRKRRSKSLKQIPIGDVDFYSALGFCRWTNKEQGIDGGVPSIEDLNRYYDDSRTDWKITESNLGKPGYRLPTASEWEFACRGKTQTAFPFGNVSNLASQYAWFATNSGSKPHPVCQLKPGSTGLFDMNGNASEWCLDWYREELPESSNSDQSFVDFGPEFSEHASLVREYRGGSFADEIFDLRSSKRFSTRPIHGFPRLGFRLARTYKD